jgi:hypothetical protein
MYGLAGRSTKILALAGLVLAATASSSAAALPARAPILGVVPHAGIPQLLAGLDSVFPSANPAGPLVLNTQPCDLANNCWVMRTNTVYAIYWMPNNNACDAIPCSTYQAGVNQYFTDIAHDRGLSTNVYSAATQYYDATGPISYSSTFAGSYVDTNPYPASGCNDGVDAVCLTDLQLQTEIQNVLTAKGWHGDTTTMFFILTPNGVGSCALPGNAGDPGQACTTDTFCAYHSGFVDSNNEPVIYGNEPFNATITGCHGISSVNGTQGSPNSPDIDPSLNTISHEHNEAITDPWGDAWYSAAGLSDETGDLCDFDFGTAAGTVGGQPYNQTINGHHYSLQQEYSNDGLGCVQHYLGIPVDFGAPTVSGVAGQGHLLTAAHGSWSQSPTSYVDAWQRCAPNGAGCANIPNAAASTYTLVAADAGHTVRVEVSAHNAAGTSAPAPSATTATIVPLPAATIAPAISGVTAVHKQLSTSNGTWNSATSFAYAWLRCAADGSNCSVIPGATTAAYVAVAADAGHTLEARVSATNTAGTTAAVSAHSALVVDVPRATKGPHISGRARVGKRLSGSTGSWTYSPTGYRYQWLRCNAHGGSCSTVRHATHSTYKLTSHDAGHRLRLRVTAINAVGSAVATSTASGRVGH